MSGDMPGGFPGFPGMPGMNMDMLQQMMNDPNIRRMTEAIAEDPAFQEMAREMQEAMLSGGMDGMSLGEGGQPPAMPGVDPSKYMSAFSRVMENPEFMAAAESLGKGLMEQSMDQDSLSMLQMFQNPENQAALKAKMEELKDDPELGDMMKDIEENGQAAMMKYMNDPEMMSKMGKKFQEAMDDPEFRSQLQAAPAGVEEEEEEDEEEPGKESTIINAASAGSLDRLKELLKEGADADMKDEEGRTALHFASGYGELECMEALLDAGADINSVDDNKNTALHYSAGYGNIEATELLVKKGADTGLKNAEDKTAKEVAEMNDQQDVAKLL